MPSSRRFAITIALATVYVAAAKFGFTMAFTAEQVTLVWPPTGLALLALLMFGLDLWPGVFLGAFIGNVTTHEPVLVALAIATGNTLEAVIAARLLRRYTQLGDSLDTLRQAIGLLLYGALASTLVSATIGVTSLCLGGVQPWTMFRPLLGTWWLGDAAGDLLIAPTLLTWRAWGAWGDVRRGRVGEAALILLGLAGANARVFARLFQAGADSAQPVRYVVFPFLIYAAIRYGVAGSATANIVTAVIAVWGTVHGFGPYAVGDVGDHLRVLQVFLVIVSSTGLLMGAAVSEHRATLRRRDAEHAATRVLADAAGAAEATSRILDVINTELHWDIGLRWTVDREAGLLRCAEIRCRRGARFPEFERISLTRTFRPGEPLPGHVWAYAAPQWVPDVLEQHASPRLLAAAIEGLHGSFAFPISVGNDVLGVFEFLSRTVRRPDDDLLWMFTAIGAAVGQFLARKRVEQQIQESEARKAGMLSAALDCIITIDQDGRIVEFNPAAERTFGYQARDVIGRQMVDIVIPESARDRFRSGLERYRSSGRASFIGRRLEMVGLRADGTEFPAELSITQLPSEAGPMFTGFVRDITQQKRMVKQLAYRATHDGLTKALNRSAFMDRLKEAGIRARESTGGMIAILFIDIDHFKAINDSLGHHAGDRLLAETARRLRQCVRPGDAVTRLGGDEFAILLERIAGDSDAAAVAERITDALNQPFAIDGGDVSLSASVGISVSEPGGCRPDELLRAADAAMYRAKVGGRIISEDAPTLRRARD